MNPRAYLRRLDRLAGVLRPRLTGSLAARTVELSTFLFEGVNEGSDEVE